ncbi:MAG TPA: FumA C-terminus/TtdB family hydratase beta subunit [bacterium]|jgi:fumarate hydratase subunit beta|nr:fumarate hydratase C-terminal domain-containing protein [Dictyoglomota bacterium]HOK29355.1 FumA C-terminus/TtdB family hydratase beta subunit [bacterium]HOL54708.1 FumA C-terminus/TtdB family hydratase beta subunit [bacterium]HON73106.1 FumA C-terminus/TtdB family hydratase beta subunit [bacterium]HOP55608.1 FumA C-terminus/TtdB family hydratase beta subunit [bacterium]
MTYYLSLPLDEEERIKLKVGDEVFVSGNVYGMRDQAHRRLAELISEGRELPVDICNGSIFYVGPTEPKPGEKVGSIGPTTSSRMDPFTPLLISKGVRVLIGKGKRSKEVINAIKLYKSVYLVTPGGISPYLRQFVLYVKPIAFLDLGPEAIYDIKLEKFPTFVGIDTGGNSL